MFRINIKEDERNQQKYNVPWQMQHLKTNYPDAIRIDTEDKTLDNIASEIMNLMI